MNEGADVPDTQPQPSLAEELAAIPYEPLLPAEKWLISLSLIIGVILLAVLSWASATFYPAKPAAPVAQSQAWCSVADPSRAFTGTGGRQSGSS